MLISKNIKLLCLFISICLVSIIIIHNKRNMSVIENDVKISTSNYDGNVEPLNDKIFSINSNINESIVNGEKIVESEESIKDESKEEDKSKDSAECTKSDTEDSIIGNDLPIEHSPENSGSFVIINSVGYEKFKFSKYNVNVYIESVNNYAKNSTDDIKVYNLIVPTSSEFNMPIEYKDLSDSQKDGILYAYSKMDDKVITVDAYSNIEANKDEYLYFKTDHHWTALGAFRAYESFMKVKGVESIPLEKYNKIDSKNKYLGSIYNMTKNERLENNLDDIWYYKPLFSVEYSAINRDDTKWSAHQIIFPTYFEYNSKYAAFMGGDTAFSHIKVDTGLENKILVIKDSYGNAFIPFLLPHYGDIFVADPRYFKENIYDVIKDNKIDELLIINYATVLQLPGFSQMLGDMGAVEVDVNVDVDITSVTAIKAQ